MSQQVMGIMVGGGPAPGINGVIGAAAIEAINNGLRVMGFYDGLSHLASDSFDPAVHCRELKISEMSRIHFDGGSILRTSRAKLLDLANTDAARRKNEATGRKIIDRLSALGVTHLLSIGGDGTAVIARLLARMGGGRLRVVHVPKTIDNDLPLPGDIPTFGYTTARHVGADIVANLMEDSRTMQRWYVVVTMGRNAGFLAFGIGKSAGATLTILPEEFTATTSIREIADIIEGAMIKRRTMGRRDGVVVLAEGLVQKLGDRQELSRLLGREVPADTSGRLRLSEFPLAQILKEEIERRFADRKDPLTVIAHVLGYELRCARPTTSDLGYTRDLGHGGVQLLLDENVGYDGVMVSIQEGELVPIPFEDMVDPTTGVTRVRQVNLRSYSYSVARSYMIRLERSDFEDEKTLEALAVQAGLSVDAFRARFQHVVDNSAFDREFVPTNLPPHS